MGQFFQNNQQIKKWDELKTEFDLIEKKFFFNAQISHAAPSSWNQILRNCTENMNNLLIQGHHLMKKHKMHSLSKLNSAT